MYYEMITTINLVNICHHTELQKFLKFLRLLKCTLSNFQICNTVLLFIVTMLYSIFPCIPTIFPLIYFINVSLYLFFKKNNLFIYLFLFFRLCWVFVSLRGFSLVAASRDHSSSRCAGLSLSQPLLLRGTRSRRAGSVVVAHGLSCLAACGIFPDQGSNPCPLHWQAGSQPLRYQGSPVYTFWPYSAILPRPLPTASGSHQSVLIHMSFFL